MTFKNKVVLITGSSQGIGKALAGQLAAKGAIVVINGRNQIRLSMAVDGLRNEGFQVVGRQGDVSRAENCERLIDEIVSEFGRLDILVNNAGVSVGAATVEHVKPKVYEEVTATNYLSAVYMTRSALPHILKSRGSILFVSSIAGLIGFPENSAYCSAKMALTGFAESLRWETNGTGVYVGIAYVGHTVNVKGKKILAPKGGTMPKVHEYAIKLTPIKVMATNLLWMLRSRKSRAYFPFSARVLVNIHHYFPRLYRVLYRQFLRRESLRRKRLAAPGLMNRRNSGATQVE